MSADRLAFLFPGQGSQSVGMLRAMADAHPEAAAVFAEADDTLGFGLAALCWNGPEEDLQLTANQQPAILTASIAVERVLRARGVEPVAVAGHSLGEYSALVSAGTLTFADALLLVRRRGELMQEAVPVGVGAMAAILGLDDEILSSLVADASREGSVCAVANLNSPGQTVISGHREAVERAVEAASAAGAKRALMLAVSAPFHSPLMAPARSGMEPHLAATSFADPRVPVVVNVDARPVSSGADLRDALVRQIDGPVRWVESVECLIGDLGVTRFVELGPGKVLGGLVKRISRELPIASISDPDGLESFLGGA